MSMLRLMIFIVCSAILSTDIAVYCVNGNQNDISQELKNVANKIIDYIGNAELPGPKVSIFSPREL